MSAPLLLFCGFIVGMGVGLFIAIFFAIREMEPRP